MKKPFFAGMSQPSTDFESVRDGRRSTLLYYDVDLSTARSVAAGTPLILNLAGNSFYVDQDTSTVGYATVHFQDTNLGISPAPIFVGPGFIANVPFTQLLVENTAQAGKRLRVFYGVDIDFQAGVNAQVSISGTLNAAIVRDSIVPQIQFASSYQSTTVLAANTPEQIFSAAANANGAILWAADLALNTNPNFALAAMVSGAAAPATVVNGNVIVASQFVSNPGYLSGFVLPNPVRIPAGNGLWYISQSAEVVVLRHALYTLL